MSETFSFCDLRELFAKANEEKSGDQLAGLAARSERERVAAKRQLADLPLTEIVRRPLIDPDHDDVSRLICETFDRAAFEAVKSLTVGEFREFILDDSTTGADLKHMTWAIMPEMAAAVTKIMSNKDLILGAAKIRNITRCRNTMGCSASAPNRIIQPTMSAEFCSPLSKAYSTAAETPSSASTPPAIPLMQFMPFSTHSPA
jgi:ethanolamine ammonia-lyase large subunit